MISRLLPQRSARPLQFVRAAIIGVTLLALGIIWYDTLTSTGQNEREANDRLRAQALIQARRRRNGAGGHRAFRLRPPDGPHRRPRQPRRDGPPGRLITETMPGLVLQQFRIDAEGYLAYSSLGPAPRNFLGDRDYFRQLSAEQADRLVSPPCWAAHRQMEHPGGPGDPPGRPLRRRRVDRRLARVGRTAGQLREPAPATP
jgi:hypothetical protein